MQNQNKFDDAKHKLRTHNRGREKKSFYLTKVYVLESRKLAANANPIQNLPRLVEFRPGGWKQPMQDIVNQGFLFFDAFHFNIIVSSNDAYH